MQRRNFFRGLAAAAAAASVSRVVQAAPAPQDKRLRSVRGKPNILFIITDDQPRASLGFLGGKGKPVRQAQGKPVRQAQGKRALTPHLDKLAAGGMVLSRCYVSSSVCTPTRYTCLTGQYASRAASRNFVNSISKEGQTNVQWNTDIRPGDLALPKVLRTHGYVTGMVGKWHNGGPREWNKLRGSLKPDADPAEPEVARALREAQDALHAHVRSCGFDYAASVNLGNFGAHPLRKLRHHNPEWITKGALDFLDRYGKGEGRKPFYLYLATTLLHGPSPLGSLKADPRIMHCGLLPKPLDVQPSRASVLKRTRDAGLPERLAGATWLDDSIGAVLAKLDQLDLADNTLVIFLSDHGMERAKGSCYEGGVRTPCVIRWPGKVTPGRTEALVQNIDFAPTILAACGAAPPKEMTLDGLDLAPLLTGKKATLRESLYCEIGYTRAVVTGRWKYLAFRIPPSRQLTRAQREAVARRYRASKKAREDKDFPIDPDAPLSHMGFPGGQNTERGSAMKKHKKTYHDADQLYDLQTDPDEQTNLAGEAAHKAKLAEMKALLKKHLARAPGTFAEFKTK